MSAAKAFPVGENPSPNDYFARFAAFLDRLLAALTPSETKAFLWALLGIYVCLLAVWRLDALLERWFDYHYPLPNPAPAAAQGGD